MIIRIKHNKHWLLPIITGMLLMTILGTCQINSVKAQENVQPYTVIAKPGVSIYDANLNMPAKVRLFESKSGIRLETPQGYKISFALKNGERVFFFREDFFNKPEVIYRSSDSLAIQATPRGGTEIVVMISSTGYNQLDVGFRVKNLSSSSDTWHLYAFLHNRFGLTNIAYEEEGNEGRTNLTAQAELALERMGLPANLKKDTAYITLSSADTVYSWGSYPTIGPLNDNPTLHKTVAQNTPVLKGMVNSSTGEGDLQFMTYPKNNVNQIISSRGDSSIIRNDSLFIAELKHFDDGILNDLDSLTVRAWRNGISGSQTIEYLSDNDTLYTSFELAGDLNLAAPQEVEASTSKPDFDQVFLSWSGVEGAEEYLIYRDSTNTGKYDSLTTTTSKSYFDTGLERYAEWSYIIVPVDSSGQTGEPSNEVTKDVPPPPPEPPVSLFRDVEDDNLNNEIYAHENEALAFHYKLTIGGGKITERNISVRLDSGDDNTTEVSNPDAWTGISRQNVSSGSDINEELTGFLLDVVEQNTITDGEGKKYLTTDRWAHPHAYFWNYLALPTIASFDTSIAESLFMNMMNRQRDNGMMPSNLLHETDPAPAEPLIGWIALQTSYATRDSALFNETQWEEIYGKAKTHFNYWNTNFDTDGDSLLERHHYPVYAKLGTIPEIWPDSTYLKGTEALDLQSFRINEAKSLAEIANRLGKDTEAAEWENLAQRLSEKLNTVYWDTQTSYYYSVDALEEDFTFNQSNDLKYRELTGMLPLWTGTVNSNEASALKSDLEDKNRFNLENGIPFLAADEPNYAQWDHAFSSAEWWSFIFAGMTEYGWNSGAESLGGKIREQLVKVLADQHEFPYHYSAAWPSANKGKASLHTVMALDVLAKASSLKTTTDISSDKSDQTPKHWKLGQNYPNPFNPATFIPVYLNSKNEIKLEVYDRIGRKIQTITEGVFDKGHHRFRFNAEDLPSGIYIYRLSVDDNTQTGVMTLIK